MAYFYGTQGGGRCRREGNVFVWVEPPEWGDFKVGDAIPEEWSVAGPFNENGSQPDVQDSDRELYGEDDWD